MALFKSKKLDYPEEKQSVLDDEMGDLGDMNLDEALGPMPDLSDESFSMPPMSKQQAARKVPTPDQLEMGRDSFKQGFVPMEAMAPPVETKPQGTTPFSAPQPFPQSTAGLFPQRITVPSNPHIYIKINKYREVMESLGELHHKIVEAKKELESIHEINNEEAHKLRESAEFVLKMEDLLRYLETTFTSPEA